MKAQIHILLIFIISCKPEVKEQYDLLIENVNIIDVESGQILYYQDVFIKDSIITEIKSTDSGGRDRTAVIDGSDKYLIPGLWDMHVHIQEVSYLQMMINHGIVGARDMGGCVESPTDGCESICPDKLNKWKDSIRNGDIQGPQLYIAGSMLTGTSWPTSLSVKTVDEVRVAFSQNLANKVDFIKVYEQIPADAYREIARLAKESDLDFVGHVSESLLLSEIIDLGQKSIEHIREPILYCFTSDPEEMEAFMVADSYTEEDRFIVRPWIDDAEKVIEAFKRNNAWFVPTMAVQNYRQRSTDSLWINHPLRSHLPPTVNKGLEKHIQRIKGNADKKGDSLWWMAHKKLVKRLNDEGIGLLAGSDMACEGSIPGYSLHEELWLMVKEAGLSPIEALRTATLNPSKYFDLPNNGQVKESYLADLILLSKNPLHDIRNTLLISEVIKNGKVQTIDKTTPTSAKLNIRMELSDRYLLNSNFIRPGMAHTPNTKVVG